MREHVSKAKYQGLQIEPAPLRAKKLKFIKLIQRGMYLKIEQWALQTFYQNIKLAREIKEVDFNWNSVTQRKWPYC